MKKNLEHSALPTAEEIRLYQEGRLSAARSHEIELIAQENPLLGEAIEGFAQSQSFYMVPAITAAIAQSAAVGAGAASTGALGTAVAGAAKVATPWWHLNGWLIGVAAGTSAAVGTYAVVEHNRETQTKMANTTLQHNADVNAAGAASAGQDNVAQYTTAIEAEQEIPALQPNEAIRGTEDSAKQSANKTADRSTVDIPTGSKVKSKAARMEAGPTGSELERVNAEVIKPISKSTVAIQIIHVLNYKMADYTAIRRDQWDHFTMDDVGLPAKYATKEERDTDKKKITQVPYVDYVTQCIKAYDEQRYQLALDRFGVVLEQYRDDVNAIFYSAMSEYHLGHYDAAASLFAKVERNMINTFDEEAFFYHAMSLKNTGHTDEANSMFVKVVQENGFYRERALEEMR